MALVLVVEDEPLLRSSLVRGLGRMPGIEVIDAANESDALALAYAQRPDMIISDIDLPDGSGIEMLSVLAGSGIRVPTVFVTAFLREFGSRVPIDPSIIVLEKPVPIDTLRDLVRQHVGGAENTPLAGAFSVADYVQLAGISHRSLSLVVSVGGVRRGTIHFVQGAPWAANDNEGTGESAFARLVNLEHAECVPGRPVDRTHERNLFGSTVELLLRVWTDTPRATPVEPLPSTRSTGSWQTIDSAPGITVPPWEVPDARDASPTGTHLHSTSEEGVTGARIAVPEIPPDDDFPEPQAPEVVEEEDDDDAPPRTRFDELKEEGLEALLVRDYRAARIAWTAAAEIRPDDPTVRANIARLDAMGVGKE